MFTNVFFNSTNVTSQKFKLQDVLNIYTEYVKHKPQLWTIPNNLAQFSWI